MNSKFFTVLCLMKLAVDIQAFIIKDGGCAEGEVLLLGKCINVASDDSNQLKDVIPGNIVTVPPNCPPGQEWINGACRDVWNRQAASATCAVGEIFIIDRCIKTLDLLPWTGTPNNIVVAPGNCPTGQQLVNGVCRDVWAIAFIPNDDIVSSGTCPSGLVNGICLDQWTISIVPSNIITVPGNCPTGQQLINGVCTDVWYIIVPESVLETRNLITVPSQCPAGYKPDANGICREIWA